MPTVRELFVKLHPSSKTPSDETLLLTGVVLGMAARLEDDLARERVRMKELLGFVSHTGCARNALGGARERCTCGLDDILAGSVRP
jgi:hypothetical protein